MASVRASSWASVTKCLMAEETPMSFFTAIDYFAKVVDGLVHGVQCPGNSGLEVVDVNSDALECLDYPDA